MRSEPFDRATRSKEPRTDRIRQPIAACHAAAFAFELLVQWGRFYPKEAVAAPPTITGATPSTVATGPPGQADPVVLRATYVLNLDAEPSALTPEQVVAVEALLRELAKEPELRIERVEAGSLRLVVSSPTNAVARLDVPKLREALESRFALHLFGLAPEHEVQELSQIREELLRASDDLLSWPARDTARRRAARASRATATAETHARERSQRHCDHRSAGFR
jgi:hypothetical protein